MTREEWNILSKEELCALSQEEFLKHLIRFAEEDFIWSKKQIEEVFKDKNTWPPDDKATIWYKEMLRENKNIQESFLKELQLEMFYYRQGMNPPFCYPEYWKGKVYVGSFVRKGAAVTLTNLDDVLFKS